jgi:RNA polymerase sigma-54 factor
MKASLNLRMGQQLALTPQLQQSIRLLLLSSQELEVEVEQALEANPLLERLDDNPQPLPASAAQPDTRWEAAPENSRDDSYEDWTLTLPAHYGSGAAEDEDGDSFVDRQAAAADGLQQHLLAQIQLDHLSDTDLAIAAAIIDAIDDDGYLQASLDDIRDSLPEGLEVSTEEVHAVLSRVQRLDPPGVGAQNLQEALRLQLERQPGGGAVQALALRLVREQFDALASHDFKRLSKTLQASAEEVQAAAQYVRSLNPRPAAHIGASQAQYITPDVFVRKLGQAWRVELNPSLAPRIGINSEYARLARTANAARDSQYVRDQLQEARWFIKALENRNDTLLRVARCIAERQRLFLDYGDEGMRPLVLRDVAEELGLHESTISRVTTQKFMHTPRGVFELKHFFSSHVGTSDGGECSSTAIRAMLKKLVAGEPPGRPLSDSSLADTLKARGINVARRTVAKYREELGIPPSSERRHKT